MVLIALGFVTTSAWTPLSAQPWLDRWAFGWPALSEGRWWTIASGSVLPRTPLEFVLLPLLVAGGVGLCEWLLGTVRTAVAAIGLQVGGVLLGCLTAAALASTGWPWAVSAAAESDAGFSAAAFGCAALASAGLRPPWRGRLRLGVWAVTLIPLFVLGYLGDLIHLAAVLVALPLGPVLFGRRPSLRLPPISRQEIRLTAAAFFVVSAVAALLGLVVDREGPLGQVGGDLDDPWWLAALSIVVDLVIAWGLRGGRRSWWRVAVALTGLGFAVYSLALILSLATDETPELVATHWLLDLLQLAVLLLGASAFRNPGRHGRHLVSAERIGRMPTDEDRARAKELLVYHGSGNRLAWITTWPENRWWFPSDAGGYVAYHQHAGVAIGLCDPVGLARDVPALAQGFSTAVLDAGLTPCFFSCSAVLERWAVAKGWTTVTVAQEAVIDLPQLEFKGKKWQDVRSAFNQAAKSGITHRLVRLAEAPRDVRARVEEISAAWVGDEDLPEMGFTLGGVPEALDPQVWVGLAEHADGTLHGVTSWLPVYDGGRVVGWTLDVMRRAEQSFRYTMEFLIASACVAFREQGAQVVSLSGAPLAKTGAPPADSELADRAVTRLGELIEPYYGFASLERFKQKFQPRHVPLFLLAPDEGALARSGVAVGRAYVAQATPAQLLRLAVSARVKGD